MNRYSLLILNLFLVDFASSSETTKEPAKDDSPQSASYKISLNDYQPTPESWDSKQDSVMKALWVYRPPSLQSQQPEEQEGRHVMFRSPHLLTRLAKPFNFGVDPYFSKGYFEPFEKRHKPVTLIAFRKNGLIPRRSVMRIDSSEVAELQSPFNEIGNLWQEEPSVFST